MNIRNCRRCGTVFSSEGEMICLQCRQEDEVDYKRVKDFLWEHPKTSLMELSDILQISTDKIKRFLRDGRLEVSGTENMLLACETCGNSISAGRYCEECRKKVKRDIGSLTRDIDTSKESKESKETKKPEGGFYFRNKDKK